MAEGWPVRASDGHTFEICAETPEQPRAALLFVPAMGVEARYYGPFAQALREQGILVAICDLRGHGTSSLRPGRGVDFGYREIVELDIPAAVSAVEERIGDRPMFLGGHSLGGQLMMLHTAATRPEIAGLTLVACAIPYYRNWNGRMRLQIRVLMALLPITGLLLGYVPGHRLGFGGTEARTLMKDWTHNAKTGLYELTGSEVDYEAALETLRVDLITVNVEGDEMAPPNAVDFTLEKLPRARGTRVQAKLSEHKPGAHLRWARDPDHVVRAISGWIAEHL
ncbi:MAG: alpha/beta fold hydrolase [Polyangiales bacterium]